MGVLLLRVYNWTTFSRSPDVKWLSQKTRLHSRSSELSANVSCLVSSFGGFRSRF